ncbi:MAG: PHP domain-containing protein [Clostridiales bacterium]|nr:PHP domain-containing protein [Clostridiales bacterium]HOA33617.1 PHP domain-containing protein [Clostridiales bacterium]HOJ35357.1 PHP domain-containing protein [Clostridiales bacterium]HOL78895.1 PHP domain-containing protein [Clostridiales bacterium]HPU66605.1 PHP domain-containing protein [Clostridiales bacterium]
MLADLHCHTKLSDGSMGIEELILLAAGRGVSTIAITDHDCLAGNVRGKVIGERHNVRVIPGVELSATDTLTGNEVHILGYLCDCPDRIEGLCHKNSMARRRAGQYMMLKAAKKFPISPEFVLRCAQGSTNIFKQHIMHALMEIGYSSSMYGELYELLFSPESEENIIVNAKYSPVEEVIAAIHSAGGIAILANPAVYGGLELAERMLEHGLNGIEVWSSDASEEDTKKFYEFAKKNKLLMTGGSNFHGMYNKGIWSVGDYGVHEDQVQELLQYKARLRRQQSKTETKQEVTV